MRNGAGGRGWGSQVTDTAPTPTVRAVVVIAALTRPAKAWERWDAATREDEPAAEVELEQARGVVRGMGLIE